MLTPTEVRAAPRGGLEILYPFGTDVLTSMLRRRLQNIKLSDLAASLAAIQAGEQGFVVLWGANYNEPIGHSSNGTAKVKATKDALRITVPRYLDTPASRIVQGLVADGVTLGVTLGVAGTAVSEKVLIDGQLFERVTYEDDPVLCESRIVMQAPTQRVTRRRWA